MEYGIWNFPFKGKYYLVTDSDSDRGGKGVEDFEAMPWVDSWAGSRYILIKRYFPRDLKAESNTAL